jgi:gluconolactonase
MDIDLKAPGLERLIDNDPPLEIIAHGLTFGEGPVWDRRAQQLYWVDIIGNTIWKWKPGAGQEVVMKPSGHANGMTFDRQGRLTIAGWCNRTILRFEADGRITTIASKYKGKKFNSPNDIVVKSDGSVYWTDSAGGLSIPGMVADDVQRYLDVQGVYRLTPDGEAVQLVIEDVTYPNGLAFSHDEKLLYVNDTKLGIIRAFDVRADGSLGPGYLFHKLQGTESGVADGMKVDSEGNVYCTGPGGIHIIDPSGKLLGRMRIAGHCTNMAWGDADWCSLYVTTFNKVCRTRVKVPGVAVW